MHVFDALGGGAPIFITLGVELIVLIIIGWVWIGLYIAKLTQHYPESQEKHDAYVVSKLVFYMSFEMIRLC
jgi:hypothetical protein